MSDEFTGFIGIAIAIEMIFDLDSNTGHFDSEPDPDSDPDFDLDQLLSKNILPNNGKSQLIASNSYPEETSRP
jgi:hypothetical protein